MHFRKLCIKINRRYWINISSQHFTKMTVKGDEGELYNPMKAKTMIMMKIWKVECWTPVLRLGMGTSSVQEVSLFVFQSSRKTLKTGGPKHLSWPGTDKYGRIGWKAIYEAFRPSLFQRKIGGIFSRLVKCEGLWDTMLGWEQRCLLSVCFQGDYCKFTYWSLRLPAPFLK